MTWVVILRCFVECNYIITDLFNICWGSSVYDVTVKQMEEQHVIVFRHQHHQPKNAGRIDICLGEL